jgi:hypothetical protein
MSLFHPPAWFPPQLTFLWPMIWVQVLMLRAQIRAAYGRGVVYRWSVTPNLRVYLVRIEWMPGQKTEHAILKPAAMPQTVSPPRATGGWLCRNTALAAPSRRPVARGPRMEALASVAPAYLLPLPET